jgi:hypothetical protein
MPVFHAAILSREVQRVKPSFSKVFRGPRAMHNDSIVRACSILVPLLLSLPCLPLPCLPLRSPLHSLSLSIDTTQGHAMSIKPFCIFSAHDTKTCIPDKSSWGEFPLKCLSCLRRETGEKRKENNDSNIALLCLNRQDARHGGEEVIVLLCSLSRYTPLHFFVRWMPNHNKTRFDTHLLSLSPSRTCKSVLYTSHLDHETSSRKQDSEQGRHAPVFARCCVECR